MLIFIISIIMIIFLLLLLSCLIVSQQKQQIISYDILNVGHHINLALQSYFNESTKVQINYNMSSQNIDSLDINITKDPIVNVSSLPLTASLKNGSRVSFNQQQIIMSKSIYNQPNTIFLMENNLIFSIRYQYSLTDTLSYVQAFKIQQESRCSQIQIMQNNSQYFLLVGCLKNARRVVLIAYKFQMNSYGAILSLKEITPHVQFNIVTSNQCSRIQFHAYRQFMIKGVYRQNGVILFCPQTLNNNLLDSKYFVFMAKNKTGSYSLNYTEQNINMRDSQTMGFSSCLNGSTYTTQYQTGFLSLIHNNLKYYSYGRSRGQCTNYMQVYDKKFISSIRSGKTQYIYIISHSRIIIKESFAPNFQVFEIKEPFIADKSLTSYSITRKFLALLYENSDFFVNLVYDLSTVYPNKVNTLIYPKFNKKTDIMLFSVSNFLQTGNYFFIYIQESNLFNLYYYKGSQIDITVIDPQHVLPEAVVYLSYTDNRTDQALKIHLNVRDFDNLTIVKANNSYITQNFKRYLNLNLSDYIIGPMGQFHIYPNNLSAFQYVNYLTEINISDILGMIKIYPIGLSVNNVISAPLINLYYGHLTKTCQVFFNQENKLVRLRDCKTLSKGKPSLQNSSIIVLSQGKYIQYNSSVMQYCQLLSNNQYSCHGIVPQGIQLIQSIKLISYYYTRGQNQVIQIILYNENEMAFGCFQRNQYKNKSFKFVLHYFLDQNNIIELKNMTIQNIYFDQGYHYFIVLHFIDRLTKNHKIIVYDKIDIQTNSSNSFIGHIIQSFSLQQVEAVFCIRNLLIILSLQNDLWVIKQYRISHSYLLRYVRQYPLYNYMIIKGGKHAQNQNFIYLQVHEEFRKDHRFFLVYSPLKSSFGVLSHKFQSKSERNILFAQQIGQDNNNSMGINGDTLFGLTQPSFIFKITENSLTQQQLENHELTRLNFNLSVVDDNNQMNILQYNFIYNQGQENIYLNISQTKIDIEFESQSLVRSKVYQLNPVNIQGPVNEYQIRMKRQSQQDSICNNFNILKRDVFTKRQCLIYHNSYKYGIMNDFISLEMQGFDVELIVTDTYVFCIKQRSLLNVQLESLNLLYDCKLHEGKEMILMSCYNTSSMAKQIYKINMALNKQQLCEVSLEEINIPSWFTYIDFDIQFNQNTIILEVPIRFQTNKIYFKASFNHQSIISTNYSILTILRSDDIIYQSQFQTIDKTISNDFLLILQNGIGIYNLSDSIASINPAIWITKAQISKILSLSQTDNFVYLKHLQTNSVGIQYQIVIELGTESSTYDIEIVVSMADSVLEGQTKYILRGLHILYQYQQYLNCKNTQQSDSRRYNQMIIKICSYQPPDLFVFANFISITNETSGYLIQFYHAKGTQSYPFRIDNIYSNLNSYDSFSIKQDTLIVGSLFNFLCYYNLASNIEWEITYHQTNKVQKSIYDDIPDQICHGELIVSNNLFSVTVPVVMSFIYPDRDDVWSDKRLYIQRAILLIILVNTIRLAYIRRKQKMDAGKIRLTKKNSSRLHDSRFQVLVKINSKIKI